MAVYTKQQLLQLFLLILTAAKAASGLKPKPDCPTSCGSLSIPYPFGTREGCYLDDTFLINCAHNSSTVIPYLRRSNVTVLNISLDGELRVLNNVVGHCYDLKGHTANLSSGGASNSFFNLSHFYISWKRNKFYALGCDTIGEFLGYTPVKVNYTTIGGCITACSSYDDITANGSCSGSGCCQISIPEGLSGFKMATDSFNNHTTVHDFNPCGYGFLVEDGAYNFSLSDVRNFENNTVPIVLDWAVGNQTCEEAQRNFSSYACKTDNSECHNSTNGVGYRCKCKSGFQGNPYLHDGCKDIKECSMEPSPCSGSGICHDFEGGYNCSCPKGYEGDGQRNGTGCNPKSKSRRKQILIIALSVSLSMLALLVGSLYLYRRLRERKLNKTRENYFRQNGGILLQERIGAHQGSTTRATIFTAEELKKATNNYDEDRVIGIGGHGTVYKGVLSDSRVVAIKKSKISSQNEIEQFINEVVVLSHINHRNIVKLLGCCLETEAPLLVYEFITNGTLSDHIHVQDQASQLSWSIRLRVATETAEALAYLHSAASTPIIHRDVKTANILLDDNLTAKVSDFGASKLVPLDQTQLTTLVQGTLGYLDPEYFQSSHLTEKSDVYSFGVVLAELLTSMKALSFVRPQSDRNLSRYFVSSMKEGRLPHILDNDVVKDANIEQIIQVASLTERCLMLKGEERPTMKEVAMELERIRRVEKHSLGATNVCGEETEYSLIVPAAPNIVDNGDGSGGSSIITGFDSLQNQIMKPLGAGR